MALQVFGTSKTGAGIIADLTTADDCFVAAGVTVGSTNNIAISGLGSDHTVNIQGTVVGANRAVRLGDNGLVDSEERLFIGENGYLAGYAVDSGVVRISAFGSIVENAGTISAGVAGGLAMFFDGTNASTQTVVRNSGLVESAGDGIVHFSSEKFLIENSGTIKAGEAAITDVGAGTSVMQVINTGIIIGDVLLGAGNDRFDTRSGTFTGDLDAGSGADTVLGSTRADRFDGGADNDTLNGGAGNDRLDGGTGVDKLQGDAGNDTFLVDVLGDLVIEAANGGSDTVLASATYVLRNNQSIEVLATVDAAATTAINLTGNNLAQTIRGNAGNNVLVGGGGNDKLLGGAGVDTLEGQAGVDTLTGGNGADKFIFRQAGLNAVNADHIVDFAADDVLRFDVASGSGVLANGAFVVGAAALDANDRFIYNNVAGQLFFDADGNGAGAQILVATLDNKFGLAASDIFLF